MSSLEELKESNKALRDKVKRDLEKRKKEFSSSGIVLMNDLKPYTTLPMPEGGDSHKGEYRTRPTAMGPVGSCFLLFFLALIIVELHQNLAMDMNKEGIVTR
jgi:hypothetical protein